MRKSIFIRKIDTAIATETMSMPESKPISETKPKNIHDRVQNNSEYKKKQEKIRKVCLEKAKAAKQASKPLSTGNFQGIAKKLIHSTKNTRTIPLVA